MSYTVPALPAAVSLATNLGQTRLYSNGDPDVRDGLDAVTSLLRERVSKEVAAECCQQCSLAWCMAHRVGDESLAFDCDDVIRRAPVSRSSRLPHREGTDGLRRPPF